MTTFVEIHLTCPACRTQFASRLITSCGNRGQDTDFRPHYWGLDPLPHFVHTCPSCEFSGLTDDFVEPGTEAERVDHDEPPARPFDDTPGSRKYELAAERYAAAQQPEHRLVGDLYLRASWCARLEAAPAREASLQRQAILHFEAALEDPDLGRDERAVITYLAGELYRRVGCFDFAQAMLARCSELEWPEEELGWLRPLVEQQTRLARQGIADNVSFGN
jgi:uncharacterized protein (DUF2225 family)